MRAILILAVLLGGCSQALVTGSNKDPRAPVALTDSQVGHVQTVVARTLKDPDSAKFDSIAAGRAPDGRVFVCGWVNAKNSFGGYVGRQPFSGQLTDGAFALSYVGSDYMLRAFIQDQCGGLGEYYWNT
jgi:hypothetical protein